MSVTYIATLPVREETVALLADLLDAERLRRGTRAGTRALTTHDQAVLVLRWFCDGTRMSQLAGGNAISQSTGYNYLHEGIGVLAARAPSLHGALLAAKMAGHSHVTIDGTLIETDRVSTLTKTAGNTISEIAPAGNLPHVIVASRRLPSEVLASSGYRGIAAA
jgi:hypothetical protein